jgi:Fur family peroxide stress response transcriptional regulator
VDDSAIRLDNMIQKLRDHDHRITPQRLAILKVLAASEGHPSVEHIYARVKTDFPTTSLATVYKNISLMKSLGEVLELGFSDDSNRYDGNKPYPHPHLVCTRCKKITDPDLSMLQDLTQELVRETGFHIVNHRMDFFGICPECQNKEAG